MSGMFLPIDHATSKIVDRFYPEEGTMLPGFPMPWEKLSQFRVTDGELTVWSGINGHGKSMFLSQVMLEAMRHDYRVFMASFEMSAARTGQRMIKQALGRNVESVQEIMDVISWLKERFIVNTITGRMNYHELLNHMRAGVEEHGCRQFVIDSLMKCGIRQDDYNAIADFVDLLQNFAQHNGVHVHLVAHSRKGDEDETPGKMEIKGPVEISNLPDNVICVWRNKVKETEPDKSKVKYDCVVAINKCREDGEVENQYGLYYDRHSFQYLNDTFSKPIRYYDNEDYPF